jgi:hypothetical protein
VHGLGIRPDFHTFPDWVVACGHIACSATVEKLHRTQAAHAGRLQRFMMAKGWNVDAEFFGYLEDILSFFALDGFPIEFKRNHYSFPFGYPRPRLNKAAI